MWSEGARSKEEHQQSAAESQRRAAKGTTQAGRRYLLRYGRLWTEVRSRRFG